MMTTQTWARRALMLDVVGGGGLDRMG